MSTTFDPMNPVKGMWQQQRPLMAGMTGMVPNGNAETGMQMAPGPGRLPGMGPLMAGPAPAGGGGMPMAPGGASGMYGGAQPVEPMPGRIPSVQQPAMSPSLPSWDGGVMRPQMGMNAEGSRIAHSPMSPNGGDVMRPNYAVRPEGSGASAMFGLDSLANRTARPMGRSANDPMRLAEQMRRAGNPNALLNLGMQRNEQAFRDAQNDKNFGQQMYMGGLQQQAMDARNERERMDRFQMWNAEQEAAQRRADQQLQQQLVLHGLGVGERAMEAERVRQQEEMDRKRVPMVGSVPIPGSNYMIPYADGRSMGTVPGQQEKPKAPTHDDISNHIADMAARGVKAQYGKTGWSYEPQAKKAETVKVVNELGKVVDFPADHELPDGWQELKKKGEGEKAPRAPETKGTGQQQTKSGVTFKLVEPK